MPKLLQIDSMLRGIIFCWANYARDLFNAIGFPCVCNGLHLMPSDWQRLDPETMAAEKLLKFCL